MPSPTPSRTPSHRLYRDPEHAMLAGVCAGIAAYFGIERVAIRLAFVLALILVFVPAALGYVALAFFLPRRPPALYASAEDEAFFRAAAVAPDDTLGGLRRRFADLEARLRGMEREFASPEHDLRRKFRDL